MTSTLIRKPADPTRADVLRGDRSPLAGEVLDPTPRFRPRHYIAIFDGLKYPVCGLGATPDEAQRAAFDEYHRTNNSGYGFDVGGDRPIDTLERFTDYWSGTVYGPLADGEGQTKA